MTNLLKKLPHVRLEEREPETIYLSRIVIENGFHKIQAVKLVDGEPVEWIQLAAKVPYAYQRCTRCDEFHTFVSVDGFCRDCL